MSESGNNISPRQLWAALLALGLLRVLSLGLYPLADTTEARYGEVARLMASSGDWITPQISAGVPFWGKPPLSFWLSAASMKIFGINELAARLPSFLLALAVLALVWLMASHQHGRNTALAATTALATSALFFVTAGAVMTDPALLFATTLCMVSFWITVQQHCGFGRSVALTYTEYATPGCLPKAAALPDGYDSGDRLRSQEPGRVWGYAFFVGLALGLLAKGPVALVLTGLPIGVWVLVRGRWRESWQSLPWLTGLLLTAILSVPWYWLAELKTPGFLEYFLLGEHWQRFLEPGWQGDLYGSGHLRPRGTIWIYWLQCTLPWSLLLPLHFLRNRSWRRRPLTRSLLKDDWKLYLLAWALAPLFFFTTARNILPTYVLTGLPAFALLTAEWLWPADHTSGATHPLPSPVLRWGANGMLLLITVLLVLIVGLGLGPAERSQKRLVAIHRQDNAQDGHPPGRVLYLFRRPYSAEFYSRGTALLVKDMPTLEKLLAEPGEDWLVVEKEHWRQVPEATTTRFAIMGEIKRFYLLREESG